MKVVVHPDVHLRGAFIDQINDWEKPDRIVFLGDTWDARGGEVRESVESTIAAAQWLKAQLHDPRVTYLAGNHDARAIWPLNDAVWCAQEWFSEGWLAAIRGVLTDADLARIKLYTVESGILLSHAGLDAKLPDVMVALMGHSPPPASYSLADLTAWLDLMWAQAKQAYSVPGKTHALLEPGTCRGGYQRVGGVIWRDAGAHEPIEGLGQIAGHSIMDEPMFRFHHGGDAPIWRAAKGGVKTAWLKQGWTLFLDTRSRHYVVIEDNVLTIKAVTWKRVAGGYEVAPGGTVTEVRLR